MWRLRRSSVCSSSSLQKWCSQRQDKSRIRATLTNIAQEEVAATSSHLFCGGFVKNKLGRRSFFEQNDFSNSRGFATRAKPAVSAASQESASDLSESDEFEDEAEDLKAFTEASEESESESDDVEEVEQDDSTADVEAESSAAAAPAAVSTPKKNVERTQGGQSPVERRQSLIRSDKLEQELWRRFCLLKREDDIVAVLDRWKEEGKELNGNILIPVVDKLKNSSRYTHALQLMEHVVKDPELSDFKLAKPLLIEITARAKGIAAAEKVFEELPEKERTKSVYSSLLARYVYVQNVKKAEALFEEMEKAGYVSDSPFALNLMMKLYKQRDDNVKFQEMLAKAQDVAVQPNIFTYNVMLELKAKNSDIEGMEKIYEEIRSNANLKPDAITYTALAKAYLRAGLLDKAELNMLRLEIGQFRKSKANFEFLMTGYGQLGFANEVERLWQKCKAIPGNGFNSFLVLQRAMAMAGDVHRVESMFNHMETWKRSPAINTKRFNNLLMAYYKRGMKAQIKEQEKKMEAAGIKSTLTDKEKLPLASKESSSSNKESVKVTASSTTTTTTTPKKDVKKEKVVSVERDREKETELKKALEEAAEKGDVKAAEKAFESCKKANMNKVGLWNRLLKAYVNGGVSAYGFVQRMNAEKMEPNEDTEELLVKLKELEGK